VSQNTTGVSPVGRLGPADLGSRVVVRSLAGTNDGRQLYRDLLGELVSADPTSLVVRTARSGEVSVPADQVIRVKQVPEASSKTAGEAERFRHHADVDPLALQRVCARSWPGIETERLGDWRMRAGGGWTGRANSTLPDGDPGCDLDTALHLVRRWYGERDLPPLLQVPLPALTGLAADLAARGWRDIRGALVQTAPTELVLAKTPAQPQLPPVRLAEVPDERWLDSYHYAGGATGPMSTYGYTILTSGPPPRFASVEIDGRIAAIARCTLDGDWVGLCAVEVAEAYRRRGLAAHLLRATAEYAAENGASRLWLQVWPSNAPAIRLYGRAGFTTHHVYRYFRYGD
jgi:N-acetylglutamate synthase